MNKHTDFMGQELDIGDIIVAKRLPSKCNDLSLFKICSVTPKKLKVIPITSKGEADLFKPDPNSSWYQKYPEKFDEAVIWYEKSMAEGTNYVNPHQCVKVTLP